MINVDYEWDAFKADSNRRKHGVDFADDVAVLEDDLALTVHDDHADETRFATVGIDALGRVLVVTYTWRGTDRIRGSVRARLSTRRATSIPVQRARDERPGRFAGARPTCPATTAGRIECA